MATGSGPIATRSPSTHHLSTPRAVSDDGFERHEVAVHIHSTPSLPTVIARQAVVERERVLVEGDERDGVEGPRDCVRHGAHRATVAAVSLG